MDRFTMQNIRNYYRARWDNILNHPGNPRFFPPGMPQFHVRIPPPSLLRHPRSGSPSPSQFRQPQSAQQPSQRATSPPSLRPPPPLQRSSPSPPPPPVQPSGSPSPSPKRAQTPGHPSRSRRPSPTAGHPVQVQGPRRLNRNDPCEYLAEGLEYGYNSPTLRSRRLQQQQQQNNLAALQSRGASRKNDTTDEDHGHSTERNGPISRNDATGRQNENGNALSEIVQSPGRTNESAALESSPPSGKQVQDVPKPDKNGTESDLVTPRQRRKSQIESGKLNEMKSLSLRIQNSNERQNGRSHHNTRRQPAALDPDNSEAEATSQQADTTHPSFHGEYRTLRQNDIYPRIEVEDLNELKNYVVVDATDGTETFLPVVDYQGTPKSTHQEFQSSNSFNNGSHRTLENDPNSLRRNESYTDMSQNNIAQLMAMEPQNERGESSWNASPLYLINSQEGSSRQDRVFESYSNSQQSSRRPSTLPLSYTTSNNSSGNTDSPFDPTTRQMDSLYVNQDRRQQTYPSRDMTPSRSNNSNMNMSDGVRNFFTSIGKLWAGDDQRRTPTMSSHFRPQSPTFSIVSDASVIQSDANYEENQSLYNTMLEASTVPTNSTGFYSNDIANGTSISRLAVQIMENESDYMQGASNKENLQPQGNIHALNSQDIAYSYNSTRIRHEHQEMHASPFVNPHDKYVQHNINNLNDPAIKSVVFRDVTNSHNQMHSTANQQHDAFNANQNTIPTNQSENDLLTSLNMNSGNSQTLENVNIRQLAEQCINNLTPLAQQLQHVALETARGIYHYSQQNQHNLNQDVHRDAHSELQGDGQTLQNSAPGAETNSENITSQGIQYHPQGFDQNSQNTSKSTPQNVHLDPNALRTLQIRSQNITQTSRDLASSSERISQIRSHFSSQIPENSKYTARNTETPKIIIILGPTATIFHKAFLMRNGSISIEEMTRPFPESRNFIRTYEEIEDMEEVMKRDIEKVYINAQQHSITNAVREAYEDEECNPRKLKSFSDNWDVWIPRTSSMDYLESPLARYNFNTVDGDPHYCFVEKEKTEEPKVPDFIERAWNSVEERWKEKPGEIPYNLYNTKGWVYSAFLPHSHARQRASVGFVNSDLGGEEAPAAHPTHRNSAETRGTALDVNGNLARGVRGEEAERSVGQAGTETTGNDVWPIKPDSEKMRVSDWFSNRTCIDNQTAFFMSGEYSGDDEEEVSGGGRRRRTRRGKKQRRKERESRMNGGDVVQVDVMEVVLSSG